GQRDPAFQALMHMVLVQRLLVAANRLGAVVVFLLSRSHGATPGRILTKPPPPQNGRRLAATQIAQVLKATRARLRSRRARLRSRRARLRSRRARLRSRRARLRSRRARLR